MLASQQRPDDGDDSSVISGRSVGVIVALFVVSILVIAAVIGIVVLTVVPDRTHGLQAGVHVAPNSTAGTITVTWTSNKNADYLTVTTDCPVDIDTRMTTVGDRAKATGCSGTHHVTVTAHDDDIEAETVIVEKDVQV